FSLVVRHSRIERNTDMQALAAGGLHQSVKAGSLERIFQCESNLCRAEHSRRFARIEVEDHHSGLLDFRHLRLEHVQLNVVHVAHPEKRWQVIDAQIAYIWTATAPRDWRALDPFRRKGESVFDVLRLTSYTGRIHFE